MGIHAFDKTISKLNQLEPTDYTDEIRLSDLKGKKLAVDISNFIFKFILNDNYYLSSFINLCMKFKKFDIQCIYVFDGNPPKEKNKVLEKRKKVRNKNVEKLNEYLKELKVFNNEVIINSKVCEKHFIEDKNDLEKKKNIKKNIVKCKKKTSKITKEHIKEIKTLLDLLKIPYVHINYEADIVCAYLVKNNIVDACLTNDNDLVCYQCPIIVKDLDYKTNTLKMININKLSKLLHLDLNQLTFLLILFGCDYSSKIHYNIIELIYKLLVNNIPINEIMDKYLNKNEKVLKSLEIFMSKISFNKSKDIKYLEIIDTKFKRVDKNYLENYKNDISKKEDVSLYSKKNYLCNLKNYVDTYYYEFNEM